LLKEDAAVRLGHAPEIQEHAAFKPKLDRTLRLRAIRRLQTQKQAELSMAERRAAALDDAPKKPGRAAKKAKLTEEAPPKAARTSKPAKTPKERSATKGVAATAGGRQSKGTSG